MLTDSHCHLASHRFEEAERATIVNNAIDHGVSRMVTLATCLSDLQTNLDIAQNPAVHACIGIHPCDVHHAPDDAVNQLSTHSSDPRVCGIGETGLDYYHAAPEGWSDDAYRSRQQSMLHQHFELAAAAKLNLVIHTRDRSGTASFDDALGIYQDYHQLVRAVFHCFIAPWELAKQVIELNGLVSFGGVATFKNAKEVLGCAVQCPAGSFMLETDAPYLAPTPHRGQRNEPAFVRHTAELIAEHRNESLESLASHTTATADKFFRFR